MRPNFVKTDGQVQKTVKPFVSIGLNLKKKFFAITFQNIPISFPSFQES